MKNRAEEHGKSNVMAVAAGVLLLVLCTALAGYASGLYITQKVYVAETATALLRLLVAIVSLLPAALYLRRRAGKTARRAENVFLPVHILVPLFLGVVLAANAGVSLLQALVEGEQAAGRTLPTGAVALLLYFLATCLVPAVLEEAIFRGGILPLLAGYGRGAALLATTLLFVLMHASLWELPVVALLGALLGLAWQYGAPLYVCIALHFANNTLAFLLVLVQARLDPQVASIVVLLIVGTAVLAFCIAAAAAWRSRGRLRRSEVHISTQSLWRQPPFWAALLSAALFFASRIF